MKMIEKKEIEMIEKKEELPIEYDVIVPVHFIDWDYFSDNLKSWFREIPIKRLLFGCNHPDETFHKTLKKYLSQYDNIEFIDQRNIKTLGMQIADLMKRVKTPWFVYFHADACPTRHSFLVMKAEVDDKVGMVESERVSYLYDKKTVHPTVYPYYYYRQRAFSGYQLIRKKAIESILNVIEDDYIYRNEDIIFQNVCENNGYRYVKSFAMHVHTNSKLNQKWTPQGENISDARAITFDMQIKGIVKYCTPNEVTQKAWRDAFGVCLRENKTDLFEFMDFIKKENPKWEKAIKDTITRLLIR